MEEEHYYIDSIDYSDKESWDFIKEGGKTDTRLVVMLSDNYTLVLRPPSLSEGRRFSISHNYPEVAKNFNNLTEELKGFGFHIPPYSFFVSDIHTKEGSTGSGLCLVSEYIPGKCLPLDYKDCWGDNKENFYIQMDKWLTNITRYSICKYLSAEEDSLFLTDVFRPIQFAYACLDKNIYLVDLDPFFDKTLEKDGKVNKRLLKGIKTIDNLRNHYFNKMLSQGIKNKDWGERSREMLKELLENTDFIKDSVYSHETKLIMRNLQQGIYYKKFE